MREFQMGRTSSVVAVILALAFGAVDGPVPARAFRVKPVPILDPDKTWYQPFMATALMLPSDRSTYAGFQHRLLDMSTIVSKQRGTKAMDRWILAMQRQNLPPEYWNIIEVLAGADQGALAIRVDNLYLSGFANATGHWHHFAGEAYIPDSTELPFGSGYSDMMRRAENLVQLELGGKALEDAFQVALHYYPGAVDNEVIQRAVATISVMICEAARFKVIRDKILNGWESGVYINDDEAKLIVSWKTASCAIILGEQGGGTWESYEAKKLDNKCNIRSAQQAVNALNVLIYPLPGQCSADFII